MAAFALPARRGDFLYSSILYADAGNDNRHARASVAELAALLRPEAPSLYSKGRKPDAAVVAKDPAWHFYSAQLIHYGLPVTKEKNTAKVRLLNAMNQFKLEVPAWILKLEGELKNEWEDENRKLKKKNATSAGKEKNVKTTKNPSKASRAGQIGDQNVNVTVNLSFGAGQSMVLEQGIHSSSTPAKAPSSTKRKRVNDDTPSSAPVAKKAAKVKAEAAPSKITKKESKATPKATVVKPEPKSTSKTTGVKQEPKSTAKNSGVKQEPKSSSKTISVKQEPKSNAKTASVKKELKSTAKTTSIKQEPKSTAKTTRVKQETELSPKSSRIKHEPSSPLQSPYIKPESNSQSASSKSTLLSGTYKASFVSEDGFYDDADGILTLFRAPTTPGLWWAKIIWGPFEGLIRLLGLYTLDTHGSTFAVAWRLRHMHNQSLTFGRKCTGEITLYRDQTFDGVLFEVPDVGTVQMQGRRIPGGSLEADWQAEWNEFVDEAYGR